MGARVIETGITSIEADIDQIQMTWTVDGKLDTLKAYKKGTLIYTLKFTYDASGNIIKIERT